MKINATLKHASILLLIVILASGLLFTNAESLEITVEKMDEKAVIDRMRLQEDALVAYSHLWDSFSKDLVGSPIYPDEFAGAFINDTHKLVINVVNLSDEIVRTYTEITEKSDAVIIAQVEYSYNYLMSMINDVVDIYGAENILTYYVGEDTNKLHVGLNKRMVLKDELHEELKGSPIEITLEKSGQLMANLIGGDKIKNSSANNRTASICIGGTMQTQPPYAPQNAILTCGHGNKRNDQISDDIGATLGTVFLIGGAGSGTASLGDFAIVEVTNSSFTPSNKVRGSGGTQLSITGTYSSLPVGAAIYKYGQATGYAYGNVTAVNVTHSFTDPDYNLYTYTGLTRSNIRNAAGTTAAFQGDSGGPIYIQSGGNYLLAGSLTGGEPSPVTPYFTIYHSPIYYAIYAGFNVKTN